MVYTVTRPVNSQKFNLATDLKSNNTNVKDLCGPMKYEIIQGYNFMNVT
jgi:hypothetical protein